jgi:hypothetical protein
MPNVFNAGNVLEQLIGTRMQGNTLYATFSTQDLLNFLNNGTGTITAANGTQYQTSAYFGNPNISSGNIIRMPPNLLSMLYHCCPKQDRVVMSPVETECFAY